MINKQLKTVQQVVSWQLCMGCGACLAVCRDNNIRLVDVPDHGLRPRIDTTECKKCGKCVEVCPGVDITHHESCSQAIQELSYSWGPVLEVWEGCAADNEIRFRGSSGGVVTALALFGLEKEHVAGVLHVCAKTKSPLHNVPVLSKTREELLARTGSRYSPAAPCEKINWIRESISPCVFIGKPCDVEALVKLQDAEQALQDKVGLTISIFCAGTPSTNGTKEVLNALGVTAESVAEIRYRGFGWPGTTAVKVRGNGSRLYQMSYEKSWGDILSHYVPLRCHLCPDGTGEFADISCGDAWYRRTETDNLGQSLVLVRTETGRKFLHKAIDSGYVRLIKAEPRIISQSQKSLLKKRRNLWGKMLAMRMMQVPVPHFGPFSLFKSWCDLSVFDKTRSVVGALRYIVSKRLNACV